MRRLEALRTTLLSLLVRATLLELGAYLETSAILSRTTPPSSPRFAVGENGLQYQLELISPPSSPRAAGSMVASTAQMNGKHEIVTGIKEVPVTQEREPAVYLEKTVKNSGIARANCCPTKDTPNGAHSPARSTFWRSAVFMAPALSIRPACLDNTTGHSGRAVSS